MAQKLREVIQSGRSTFGSSLHGSDWCIKALHPSDPIVEVRGIPDQSAFPSVFVNYQSTFTLGANPAAAAGSTWSFDMQMLPHPVQFLSALKTDSVTPTGVAFGFLNQQLGNAASTHWEKYQAFKAQARRWRLAYMSVTVYQDGPDLANQGTLVVCQKPVMPGKFPLSSSLLTAASPPKYYSVKAVNNCINFAAQDLPNYEVSQTMPNAYFNKSKEGCYVPLKLTHTCQRWRSIEDDIRFVNTYPNPTPSSRYGNVMDIPLSSASYDPSYYPFAHQSAGVALGATNYEGTSTTCIGNLQGQETSDFLNDIWADISARNLATTTSYSFFVRCGIEMQVAPGTVLSPHQKLSPPHDPMALETYFAISRELKDAYPADYNDLGKIWDTISSAAKSIAPFLNFIPEVGPILSGGVIGVTKAGDMIREATRGKKMENISAAGLDKARAQREVTSTLTAAKQAIERKNKAIASSYGRPRASKSSAPRRSSRPAKASRPGRTQANRAGGKSIKAAVGQLDKLLASLKL